MPVRNVGFVERAQATVEYVALVSVALIAACLLVRFATPAERIARDLALAVLVRPHRAPVHAPRRAGIHPRHSVTHPCLCPFAGGG